MMLHAFPITPNNRKVVAFVRHFDLPVKVRTISFKDRRAEESELSQAQPHGTGTGTGLRRMHRLGVERDPVLSGQQVS